MTTDTVPQWVKRLRPSMRQIHRAGEKTCIDFSGKRPRLVDRRTGELRPVELFVSVLGASSLTYAEATRTQQLPDWVNAHIRMAEYFGGSTTMWVPDQLKSAITRPCGYEAGVNRTYEDLAAHYGAVVLPARPRKPRDKSIVSQYVPPGLSRRGAFPISRSSAVCRQRWTVRLGEVEPVFGQTGKVVLDITAQTAHDGALKWTRTPSTPRAARSIFATFPSTCALPSGGRWSLRRVLQRPGWQRKRSGAKSSCGPSRTSSSAPSSPPVLQRAVRSAAVGDAASALVGHLLRRMRSDGLETVNVRTSRGTTVPVTTPYYREKHARGAKRRPGLYPIGANLFGPHDPPAARSSRSTPRVAAVGDVAAPRAHRRSFASH